MQLSSGTNLKQQHCNWQVRLLDQIPTVFFLNENTMYTRTYISGLNRLQNFHHPSSLLILSHSFSPLPFPTPLHVPAKVMRLHLPISLRQPVPPPLLIMFPAPMPTMILILVPLLSAEARK